MIGSFLSVILEVIVATLLLATIAYCIIVNRKLEKLRGDQENLKSIIRDLNQSTLHAESATSELRSTVEKASKDLALQINRAEHSALMLRKHNDTADGLLNRLSTVTLAAHEPQYAAPKPDPYVPRNGFPLAGAAAKEEFQPTVTEARPQENPWPQLSLSSLSAHGMPDPGSPDLRNPEPQQQSGSPPEPDRPGNRSRFQWEP